MRTGKRLPGLKRVFLSCVSSQFGQARGVLKDEFARRGIELRIQEDFATAPTPGGTLVRIYRYLKGVDLVVQLIGSHPPDMVRAPVFSELLHVNPQFRNWLAQRAILPLLQSGELGYTDFEAYLAKHMDVDFLPVRFGSGAQPAHESRLRAIGQHVNVRIDRIEDLVPVVEAALQDQVLIDSRGRRTAEGRRQFWRLAALIAFLVAGFVGTFALQLSATATRHATEDLTHRQYVDHIAAHVAIWSCFIGFHLVQISRLLTFSFRMRASLRNGTCWLLAASALGWMASGLDELAAFAVESSSRLIGLSLLLAALCFSPRATRANRSWVQVLGLVLFSTLLHVLMFKGLAWTQWSFDWVYWLVALAVVSLMMKWVRVDTEELDAEAETGSSDPTPGVTANAAGFYLYDRQTVSQARQVQDFTSKL